MSAFLLRYIMFNKTFLFVYTLLLKFFKEIMVKTTNLNYEMSKEVLIPFR